MNLFSNDVDNKNKSDRLYNELNEKLEEYYQITIRVERKIAKIKMLGQYNSYFSHTDNIVTLIHNLADGIKWQDYNVVYIPREANKIDLSLLNSLKPNILFVGPKYIPLSVLDGMPLLSRVIFACEMHNITYMSYHFDHQWSLEDIIIYGQVFNNRHKLTEKVKLSHLYLTFHECINTKRIAMLGFDYSELVDMSSAFEVCEKLEELYIENLNTPKLKRMDCCFEDCCMPTVINLGLIDTSHVESMRRAFYACARLKHVDLSNSNLSSVEYMEDAFMHCVGLSEIDMTKIRLKKKHSFNEIFNDCIRLSHRDIINYKLANIANGAIGSILGGLMYAYNRCSGNYRFG